MWLATKIRLAYQRKVEMSGFSPDGNVRFHGLLQGCWAGTSPPLPRARMPMLQSVVCIQALRFPHTALTSFFAHERRYGAGVSTSGSQPENPGSIPGTATKLSPLISSAFHAKKSRRSYQFAKRQLLLDNPESCFTLAPSVIVIQCRQSKI
jgi:hypothetical protein